MSIEAMKLAQALICSARLCEVNSMSSRKEMLRLMIEAIDTLRTAIEQAEKPWVKTYSGGKPQYTTPEESKQEPVECMCGICKRGQRQWQGLTDDEIMEPWPFENRVAFARWLEAKLKEKNNG